MEIKKFELPKDFEDRMRALLKEEWEEFRGSYGKERYQALRFNTLKKNLSKDRYEGILSALNISGEQVPWEESGYYFSGDAAPGKHIYHEIGLYYIQEPSAMSAAALLRPEKSDRVLDLCAAPGGKSVQLASYMGQEGLLVSNEIHPQRCRILSRNIERMGIANAIVTNEDSGALAERFPEFFHKILVDAPCSGEGMFRKNTEAVKEWSSEQVKLCAKRQEAILEDAARMLMPGGRLVYSTCTFSPEENEEIIGGFLKRHGCFKIEELEEPYFDRGRPEWCSAAIKDMSDALKHTFRLWPHKLRGEGHFAASLVKEGSTAKGGKEAKSSGQKLLSDKKKLSILKDFASASLSESLARYITEGRLVLFGEQLYRAPEAAFGFGGLKLLRAGLHIGEFKKDRFEPSHGLALYMGKEDACNVYSLRQGEGEYEKFLRGEMLEEANGKGWSLVCADGFSAGWGKAGGGRLKNHYPKGLRL